MNELYEVILTYNDYLRQLPRGCKIIAALLKDNQIELAKTNISYFSEGLAWLSEAQYLMKINGIESSLELTDIEYTLIQINKYLERREFLEVAEVFDTVLYNYFFNIPLLLEA